VPADFCVVCGRTDRPVVDGVCAPCFTERTPLVHAPEKAVITVCPICGAKRVGAHWEGQGLDPEQLGPAELNPFLTLHPEATLRSVEWTDESINPLLRTIGGRAHLRFRGSDLTQNVTLTVRIDPRTCEACSRQSGHFYTATIQLRAAEDAPREKAPARRARLMERWEELQPDARPEWRRAISWAEERPEGWDLFLNDTLAARSLSRLAKQRLGASLKESATLWGRKHGQDVYRVTFCLRLPSAPRSGAPGARARRRGPARAADL
jgi:nonsense-mediated mRNA decay protein 3